MHLSSVVVTSSNIKEVTLGNLVVLIAGEPIFGGDVKMNESIYMRLSLAGAGSDGGRSSR